MRTLPRRANLEQLRKQAKELLRAQRNADLTACDPLRGLARFADSDDDEILASRVSLREAQQALAMDYGFGSWRHLGAVVTELVRHRSSDDAGVPVETLHSWQSAVDILAALIPVPVALIMRVVDEDIEVFLSSKTEGNPYEHGDREHLLGSGLYCETVIRQRDRLLVPDALSDPDWRDNPDIKLGMVSYLGFPILLPDGVPFGTICVLDRQENAYSAFVEKLMLQFKALLEAQLEAIIANQQLAQRIDQLDESLTELRTLRTLVPICMYCKAIRLDDRSWIPIESFLVQRGSIDTTHSICDTCWHEQKETWTLDESLDD